MCEYCKNGMALTPIKRIDGIDLYVEGSAIISNVEYMIFGDGGDVETEYDINYCPMCGRKLGGDAS